MNESGPDEELFFEQQERVDELFKQLKKDLKLDEKQATKCLVDWVYVNADDLDYLALAAERDAEGIPVELSEFLAAAAKAWLEERQRRNPDAPPGASLSADEILHALDSFIMAMQEIGK